MFRLRLLASAWVNLLIGCSTANSTSSIPAETDVDGGVVPDGTAVPPDSPAPDSKPTDVATDVDSPVDGAVDAASSPLSTRFSPDFQAFLKARDPSVDWMRDGTGGSFGGRTAKDLPLRSPPVVFVHGNSDSAVGLTKTLTGWNRSRAAFIERGWDPAALFGLTWGPADPSQASNQTHSKVYVQQIRAFLTAVHDYAGTETRLAIVAHSMGVTLARKAVKGGTGQDSKVGFYDLGKPLDFLETFVGISGANRGLTTCYSAGLLPTCSSVDGFWPGANAATGPSTFLAGLNTTIHDEGRFVFSLWSSADEILGFDGIVWGKPTAAIAGQDAEVRLDTLTHMGTKDESGPTQWKLVLEHKP